MNSIVREYYPTFEMYQALRGQLMDLLSDDDPGYTPGGANPPLGALCREIGETEHAYVESFLTFSLDLSYRHPEPEIERSVAALRAWYAELDGRLREVIESLTQEDVDTRVIDRGGGFTLPPMFQLTTYNEALLIFYGKTSVYLKAVGRTLPDQWREWIG